MLVQVEQGSLQGCADDSVISGTKYLKFLGIPYGKPPVGDLRYQPPQPADSWDGIRDATKEGNTCLQANLLTRNIIGSEDCLYLNVYVPASESDEKISKNKKAVMVFIHGGGYMVGSGSQNEFSPDFLIDQDVLIVTINYRLHVFGFLNLEIPECAGNVGLKDQLLALKWIKRNIASFGGDSDNITLFGSSAGSSSVHYHTVSPLSKGLFNRAVLQSGSCLSPWAFIANPTENAFKLGRILGFNGDDSAELFRYLKNTDGESITRAHSILVDKNEKDNPGTAMTLSFVPSLEKTGIEKFVSDFPRKMLQAAEPVPLMAGICNKDGMLILMLLFQTYNDLKDDFTHIVRSNMNISDEQEIKLVAEKLKKYYFKGEEISDDKLEEMIDLYTDIFFNNFYDWMDYKNLSNQVPVYIFQFSHEGNIFEMIRNTAKLKYNFSKGAGHGDELRYLFHRKVNKPESIEEKDLKVVRNMCQLWTNFAKYGNPTEEMQNISWFPFNEKPCYLDITTDLKLINGKINEERLKFWEDLKAYTNKN